MASDDEFACSHCGAMLPAAAKFCRHCGASDDFGWGENEHYFEDELPEGWEGDPDGFDYDEFVAREFPDQVEPTASQVRGASMRFLLMALICLGILAAAILSALNGQLF